MVYFRFIHSTSEIHICSESATFIPDIPYSSPDSTSLPSDSFPPRINPFIRWSQPPHPSSYYIDFISFHPRFVWSCSRRSGIGPDYIQRTNSPIASIACYLIRTDRPKRKENTFVVIIKQGLTLIVYLDFHLRSRIKTRRTFPNSSVSIRRPIHSNRRQKMIEDKSSGTSCSKCPYIHFYFTIYLFPYFLPRFLSLPFQITPDSDMDTNMTIGFYLQRTIRSYRSSAATIPVKSAVSFDMLAPISASSASASFIRPCRVNI